MAEGLAIIDAGHYGLEAIFVNDMASYLEQYVEDVEVVTAKTTHPFQMI